MQQCTLAYNSVIAIMPDDLLIFIVILLTKRLKINENFIIYDERLFHYILRIRMYVDATSLIHHVMLIGNRIKEVLN